MNQQSLEGAAAVPDKQYLAAANYKHRRRLGWFGRVIIVLVTVVMLAGAAVGAGMYWHNRQTTDDLSVEQRQQLREWLSAHNPDFYRLGAAITTVGTATSRADVHSTRADPALVSACGALQKTTAAMRAVPPIPGKTLQQHLSKALDAYVDASARCRRAGEQGVAQSLVLLTQSHEALASGGGEMETLKRLINRAVGH
ncbi:MAG: hypothetical protein QOH28_933 [Actinomycetota bacterium]|nr:hypothetical protein [Actinomycetota bacterium]